MNHKTLFAAGIAVAAISSYTWAIVIRHDRPDSRYIEKGKQYQGVCRLGDAHGTLIAPNLLLTAAHVVEEASPFMRARVQDAVYTPQDIFFHPSWHGEPGSSSSDVAIVRLDRAVTGVTPVPLYEGSDEKGQTVVFVGSAMTGNGQTGPTGEDGIQRAATNVCEETMQNWMRFRFDPPERATDLEGISGPGDSGSPAFIERDGTVYIAGVSSSNDSGDGSGPCTYGTDEYYVRVSRVRTWIEKVVGGRVEPGPSTAWRFQEYQEDRLPAAAAAQAARTFVNGWNAADFDAAMRAFEQQHRSKAALQQRPIAKRLETWRELHQQWGRLKPEIFVVHDNGDFEVQVSTALGGQVALRFMLASEEPTHVSGIRIVPVS